MPGEVVDDPAVHVSGVGHEQKLVVRATGLGRKRSGSVAWWSGVTGTEVLGHPRGEPVGGDEDVVVALVDAGVARSGWLICHRMLIWPRWVGASLSPNTWT